MTRYFFLTLCLMATIALCGCHTDIVSTEQLARIGNKCVYITNINTEPPHIGQVLRDVIEKELLRRKVQICGPEEATIFISGSAFLTQRSEGSSGLLGSSSTSSQAIESVSLTAKDAEGQLLLSASFDNRDRFTASRLGREFGSALAGKLK